MLSMSKTKFMFFVSMAFALGMIVATVMLVSSTPILFQQAPTNTPMVVQNG